jgi:RsiW-degrading membrane proteinase PrsW (M82 family)
MILFYILIAFFIAWIWVDYYRLIDIYESESLKYFILTFFLGCCSVLIVFAVSRYIPSPFVFEMNGNFINDFLYCVFKIGMVEEFAKTVPFIIIYLFLKKQLNEPIDYLAFISVSALGFSATENILYFYQNGPSIIDGRAILSTVGHMFNTSLIAYGLIQYKYNNKKNGILGVLFFFFLAALSHGFYDFWLLYEGTKTIGWVVTILYFFVTISMFASILNNAINNSAFFSYKKVIDSSKVAQRLLMYYAVVFLLQFIMIAHYANVAHAATKLTSSIVFTGFIVFVTCVRLSRFKLIQNRWEKIKIEFPFSFYQSDPMGVQSTRFKLSVKGESYNEAYISVFYEEYFFLNPLSKNNTYLGKLRLTYIEKKLFLKNDEIFYVAKVFHHDEAGAHETMILKPKTADETMVNDKYPIVAVLKIEGELVLEHVLLNPQNFKFKEWAFIKPKSESEVSAA